MTAYLSDRLNPRLAPMPVHGNAENVQVIHGTVALPAAATTSDTFGLCDLPPSAVFLGADFVSDTAYDTNGSPTATLNVGTTDSAARFLSANTGFRSTTPFNNSNLGLGYKNTTNGRVRVQAALGTAAATGAAANLQFFIRYVVEE